MICLLFHVQKTHALTTINTKESGEASIESNENIDDNVLIFGNNVYIRGTINDDLFVAGANIFIEGQIKGNLFVAGNIVKISGNVNKDVFGLANSFLLESNAYIERDLLMISNYITIDGDIGRNVSIGSTIMSINSQIKGNANITSQTFHLEENASIMGNLNYTSKQPIDSQNNSKINNEIIFTPSEQHEQTPKFNIYNWITSLIQFIVAGLILSLLVPKWLHAISKTIKNNILKSTGIGIVISIITPIIVIITLITIIGSPLSLIISILYLLMIVLCRFLVAYCIGSYIGKEKWHPAINMIIGATILHIIFYIPIVSFFVQITVVLIGLGAIYIINPIKTAK